MCTARLKLANSIALDTAKKRAKVQTGNKHSPLLEKNNNAYLVPNRGARSTVHTQTKIELNTKQVINHKSLSKSLRDYLEKVGARYYANDLSSSHNEHARVIL